MALALSVRCDASVSAAVFGPSVVSFTAEPQNRREVLYLYGNEIGRFMWNSYEGIVTARRKARLFLVDDTDRIRSIANLHWATINV